ncbi:hypothetical protein JCGZ_22056 [Jatropha curcas]|uniref:Uncharacterized protein n=1 Tax=Jatropha curcas TaxID=180498 RepID=A0A067K5A2_JATCU|nr:hypothetical protein JCGZ_22056 [Jatropha curcas]
MPGATGEVMCATRKGYTPHIVALGTCPDQKVIKWKTRPPDYIWSGVCQMLGYVPLALWHAALLTQSGVYGCSQISLLTNKKMVFPHPNERKEMRKEVNSSQKLPFGSF